MSTIHTTGSIAQAVQGRLVGRADLPIAELAAIDQAGAQSLTFIRDKKFAGQWAASKAAAALVTENMDVPGHDDAARALIFVGDADLAMVKVLALFDRGLERPAVGVHPTAVVDPRAEIAATARVGPLCIIGPGARVGEHATLMGRVTLGAGASIGPGSVLHPGVVVYDRCTIGAQTILHANTSIGADGFGYRPDPSGRGLIKIPHIGTVQIGNGVEIGANTCVDRGKFGATVVGDGAKIDNLVQIGHNCRIGRCAIICGMAGLAGSVTIGDGAMIGGAVGIIDGVVIGAGARIGAKSAVMSEVPAGQAWTGLPAAPHREQMRAWSTTKQLPWIMREVKKLMRAAKAAGWKLEEAGGKQSHGFGGEE